MSEFNPCRMCGSAPLAYPDGLMWVAMHCGCSVEAFTQSECAAKWDRLNPVHVSCINDKEAK